VKTGCTLHIKLSFLLLVIEILNEPSPSTNPVKDQGLMLIFLPSSSADCLLIEYLLLTRVVYKEKEVINLGPPNLGELKRTLKGKVI
jgi:hypothetical protein